MNDKPHRSVEQIKAELYEAQKREEQTTRMRRDAVVPEYQYTISPSENKWDRIYDPTCALYHLEGKVLNADELRAVGKTPFEGGMNYLWNGITHSLVCAVGGGSVFIKDQEVHDELGQFIYANREGGDVTHIIEHYKKS